MIVDNTKVPMTDEQLRLLALHTCQWCDAVLQQGKRFLNAFEATNGKLPWEEDDHSSMFLADKVFLITAIHHAIVNLERFNDELVQGGDSSFQPVLDAIATKEERQKIREWRNMNEHDIDYMLGRGRKQHGFVSKVKKENLEIETNAFTTYLNGNIGIFLIGSIEIDKLLIKFKDNLPSIKIKTEEVFNHTLLYKSNDFQNSIN